MVSTPAKIGIILAAGKGTRLNCVDTNKTALSVQGKPLVWYGATLFAKTMDLTVVVVGAFAESVTQALRDFPVQFVTQQNPNGTGHAAQVALQKIASLGITPKQVYIGYGDHLMFYTPAVITSIGETHAKEQAAVTLVSVEYENPDELAWGRVVRNVSGEITAVIEQKDATPDERKITEENAGFYCCEYSFLTRVIDKLEPSPATGELYLTDIVKLALELDECVVAHQVPFSQVGTGVNTPEQLERTELVLTQNSQQ